MKIFLDTIRSLIIRSEFLIFLMNSLIKIKNGHIYKKEIEKRSGLNLFDYSSLATPLPYYPNDKVTDNNYYGISNALKEYMHYKGDLDAYIEHGVFLGSVIPKNERLWKISRIITFSENRKKFLLQGGIGLPIIKIGPYIHYAKDFLNEEELKHTKAKIGRTLLVFPSHSIKNVTADYDIQEFITFIDEVILVEDGPLSSELNDIISEYSAKYPTLKIIPLPTNQGLGKALNEGLKHCSYDIVARMDTDDIAKPDRFEKQLAVFEKYLDIDVVGAWIDEFEDDISEVKSVRKLPELPDDIRQFAKRRNPINHPVVMFRKSAVLAAGGYQHFPLFEDYYLWIRMLMNGAKFYNIQESLLYFRFSPEMFKRRGGWRYVISELHFLQKMRQMHFISFSEFMQNLFVRFSIRLIPNSLRAIVYTKLIR